MSESIKEIKGYQLQGTLGEGGFGTVYRAYQPLIRREVAMKVIRLSSAVSAGNLAEISCIKLD